MGVLYYLAIVISFVVLTQSAKAGGCSGAVPTNDNCASAIILTVDGARRCDNTHSTCPATTQTGECFSDFGGVTEQTVWYRFTATNDSLVLNFIRTNSPECLPIIRVFGPFASDGGCVPSCTYRIYDQLMTGDPGAYILLTGLSTTGNNQYLVQIQGNECGGNGAPNTTYCIGVYNPAKNTAPIGSNVINSCGTVFNGSTGGGYFPSGTSPGFNNLDNNSSTTCPTCTAGDDVDFVINNDSWFTFCAGTAGTWQVTFNVGTCVFSGVNSGAQMALFTGTTSNLTWVAQAPDPTRSGNSWTSPTFPLAAGQCAFLVVDGFGGDACNYSYTLTNVTGGCIVLPIQLLSFNSVINNNDVKLIWKTIRELNNDFFTIERSYDGVNYELVSKIKGAGTSNEVLEYSYIDRNQKGVIYYRLLQTDYDGTTTISAMSSVKIDNVIDNVTIFPNPIIENSSLQFNSEYEGEAQLSIFDVFGKRIVDNRLNLVSGSNSINVETSNLPSGIYFIELKSSNSNNVTRLKIIKD